MIQANELRIGNWYDHNGSYRQVTPNTIEEVWEGERIYVNPIPLTPEILEKCGFIRSPAANSTYISIPQLKAEIHFEDFRAGVVCVLYCSTGSFIPCEIKYLHQLQNLYFALTGEELNVQL